MGITARLWQVDAGGGRAWKEPAGPAVPEDFPAEFLDDHGGLDLDQGWQAIDSLLDQRSIAAPWSAGDDELEADEVQQLATKLKPLDWASLRARGVELPEDEEPAREMWMLFRHFVVDAARGCNAIAWELD